MSHELSTLAAAIGGRLIDRGHPDYDEARRVWAPPFPTMDRGTTARLSEGFVVSGVFGRRYA